MARALKVFRLPIGFHDAYVAAPTQKAAIEAWGSDKDVFTRKQAELVEDPALTKEPLARPGEVIKCLRGTAAEQIAALGETEGPAGTTPQTKAARPKPRPSRKALEDAKQTLKEVEARHAEERAALERREAELARDLREMEKAQRAERERLEARREKAETAYDVAMRAWRG